MRFPSFAAAASIIALLPGALSCFMVDFMYQPKQLGRLYGTVRDNSLTPLCTIQMQGAMTIRSKTISKYENKEVFTHCEDLVCADPNAYKMSVCRRPDDSVDGDDFWQLVVQNWDELGLGGGQWTQRGVALNREVKADVGVQFSANVWGCTDEDLATFAQPTAPAAGWKRLRSREWAA